MEAHRMRALIRSLTRLFNPASDVEISPNRDSWCCSSCADAWLLGRLAEAARVREQGRRLAEKS
jgi:hypothetical protein